MNESVHIMYFENYPHTIKARMRALKTGRLPGVGRPITKKERLTFWVQALEFIASRLTNPLDDREEGEK